MKISIIIPNYNGLEFLEKCFLSISKQNYREKLDIIVVDNGSDDGSIEYIKEKHPEYYLIQNKKNLGFAAAVNQGIKSSDADYIFLLNNDVVLDDNCIMNLLECMKKDENIFAVASKMIQYHDRSKIDDAGDEYTLFGWTSKVGDGKSSDLYNNGREIFSTCAGAGLYRRNIFNLIGYFDENFFAYMEDVDIGYRARIYGYISVYCPKAVVYHVGSSNSGSKYNEFKIKLAARNNVYVPYKNMPWPQLLLNCIFLILGYFVKYLFFARKGHGNDYLKGLREGLTSLDKINKVKYKNERFTNYLRIEWLLIINSVKYIIFKRIF